MKVLDEAGNDPNKSKARSSRGASTSKASAKGLSCKEILEMARWTKATIFRRHYLRDIVAKSNSRNSFQQTILS